MPFGHSGRNRARNNIAFSPANSIRFAAHIGCKVRRNRGFVEIVGAGAVLDVASGNRDFRQAGETAGETLVRCAKRNLGKHVHNRDFVGCIGCKA